MNNEGFVVFIASLVINGTEYRAETIRDHYAEVQVLLDRERTEKLLELIASVMLLTSFISFVFGRSAFGFNVCIVESALRVFAKSSLRTFSTFVPSFFTTV